MPKTNTLESPNPVAKKREAILLEVEVNQNPVSASTKYNKVITNMVATDEFKILGFEYEELSID
ncbi:hypothetical protein [Flavobacterium taihuense]|uniref:Uncharacterized protein n=1 Tax=Flavobacterium taihuense TaxID=2857508 RepID=A0ABS6XZ76_9FLAO|nr:hypothetical protein [Flavobacterium taihuense]MBW4361976.1 hypothetical protein [Flavobacterium taihuense]